jgi:hypothetical protein
MKASVAVLIVGSLLASTSTSGLATEKPPAEGKALESKPAQTDGKSEGLFADTRKYLAENAAKTAGNVRHNASRLNKRFSSEPAPVPKAKKARSKKTVKADASRSRKPKPAG